MSISKTQLFDKTWAKIIYNIQKHGNSFSSLTIDTLSVITFQYLAGLFLIYTVYQTSDLVSCVDEQQAGNIGPNKFEIYCDNWRAT